MANQSFYSFGKENVGEFTIGNISYFSESEIWLGKLLANGIHFAKFAKFSLPKFCAIRYAFKHISSTYLCSHSAHI